MQSACYQKAIRPYSDAIYVLWAVLINMYMGHMILFTFSTLFFQTFFYRNVLIVWVEWFPCRWLFFSTEPQLYAARWLATIDRSSLLTCLGCCTHISTWFWSSLCSYSNVQGTVRPAFCMHIAACISASRNVALVHLCVSVSMIAFPHAGNLPARGNAAWWATFPRACCLLMQHTWTCEDNENA